MGLHRYARFVACCTLLVVMSGAAVTSSRDLPRQAVFHSLHTVAGVAGALLMVGLAIWLLGAGSATWLRRIAWITLAVVIVDAGLGEFQGHGSFGPSAGTLHACLAALLFAGSCAIVLFTSPAWRRDPDFVQDYGWPSLRFLSSAAVLFVAVQVGFGSGFRHSAVGIMPHLLGALVVALFIMIVGAFVTHQFPLHASLRPLAVALMAITGIQVFLGMAAFLLRLMQAAGTLLFLAISVAHVATGSLTLAVSLMLAIEIRRSVRPRAQETP
jgi:hypothetical protein